MGERHGIEVSYGSFFLKYTAIFIAILTIATLAKDFSQPVDQARARMFAVWWGLPLLYVAGVPLYLIVEIYWIIKRDRIESTRSSPAKGRTRHRPPRKPSKRTRR